MERHPFAAKRRKIQRKARRRKTDAKRRLKTKGEGLTGFVAKTQRRRDAKCGVAEAQSEEWMSTPY